MRIVVGDVGEANTDITQIVEIMRTDQDKWKWLLQRMVEFMSGKDGHMMGVHLR